MRGQDARGREMKSTRAWAGAIMDAARAAAAEEDTGPEAPPAELRGADLDMWIIEREIASTREEMHKIRRLARAGGGTHGLAALGKRLDELIERRAMLRPPAPPTAGEEEKEWRLQAEAVLRLIEAGVIEAEQRAAERAKEAT